MNNIQKTLDFLFKYRKLNTVFHVTKKKHTSTASESTTLTGKWSKLNALTKINELIQYQEREALHFGGKWKKG